ncbi:uncharacterized protein LOC143552848 [Bidens hawaiensis]|uniref:uncharacterized protein LOC143552848 n=1 Tax=Bidens hawaiensis TaxID=980011 RepID=UPI00404AC525
MEALSCMMKRALDKGLYRGLKCGSEGPVLSHLLYADDVIFLEEWTTLNALNLSRILRCFYLVSGLGINLSKCCVFGTEVNGFEKSQLAMVLGCRVGDFPFTHIGLMVGRNMKGVNAWGPVVELFRKRLTRWKAKQLSFGGRVTVPEGVMDKLERLRRLFFWGGSEEKAKMNWVAWDKIMAPIEYGGLGLGRLRDVNVSLLAKWWWRFKNEKGRLWWKDDRVVWLGDKVGGFSVRDIKLKIVANVYTEPEFVFDWNRLVPRKVSFVAWRAVLDRLPTFVALAKRNIPVRSNLCPVCDELEASVEHIFISCGLAQSLWCVISQWCKMPDFFLFSFRDLLEVHKYLRLSSIKANILQAVCLIATWCLWKKRNDLVHSGVPIQLPGLVQEIKVLGFLWVKNRGKMTSLTWENWCRFKV